MEHWGAKRVGAPVDDEAPAVVEDVMDGPEPKIGQVPGLDGVNFKLGLHFSPPFRVDKRKGKAGRGCSRRGPAPSALCVRSGSRRRIFDQLVENALRLERIDDPGAMDIKLLRSIEKHESF